jgi:squalene-associated FAD-dependent desaturase
MPKRIAYPPAPRVLVIGGGLAGLASASALVGRGLDLSLIESRPRLGGRAGSFTDPATGELVDNAQHVSLGCCTNLAHFCRRVGSTDGFRRERAIVFLAPDGRSATLRGGLLPAPFHLLGSFSRFGLFTLRERFALARVVAKLRRRVDSLPGESFRAWLERHEQGEQVIEWFWAPLLVSALNERLDRIDPVYARQVVVDGLLRNRDGYTIEIPRIPLGELYGTRLESWLAAQGVNLRLGTSVRSILLDEEGSARGAVLRDGTPIEADLVLLAVPFDRVRALLPAVAQARWPRLRAIELHEAVPITGIHLWFDRKVCPHTFALLLGRTVQWVFDHTAIRGENGAGQYLQLVVSASYELAPRAPAEIRDIALADLRALWPEAMANASLLRWRVITEH